MFFVFSFNWRIVNSDSVLLLVFFDHPQKGNHKTILSGRITFVTSFEESMDFIRDDV